MAELAAAKIHTVKVTDDVYSFRRWEQTPFGFFTMASHVILGKEPILVDTNAPVVRETILAETWKVVDPKDVRWIFITHDDRDHNGNLMQMLELCPNARFVTNFIGMARMTEEFDLPMNRIQLANSGDRIEANGRTIGVLRPPIYDSPATIGLYDPKSSVYFASDCFAAFLPAPAQMVGEVPPEDYARGLTLFQTANSPWCHFAAGSRVMNAACEAVRSLGAKLIVSSHGPTAEARQTDMILDLVLSACAAPTFAAPTQKDLEAMMAEMSGGALFDAQA